MSRAGGLGSRAASTGSSRASPTLAAPPCTCVLAGWHRSSSPLKRCKKVVAWVRRTSASCRWAGSARGSWRSVCTWYKSTPERGVGRGVGLGSGSARGSWRSVCTWYRSTPERGVHRGVGLGSGSARGSWRSVCTWYRSTPERGVGRGLGLGLRLGFNTRGEGRGGAHSRG